MDIENINDHYFILNMFIFILLHLLLTHIASPYHAIPHLGKSDNILILIVDHTDINTVNINQLIYNYI